MGSSLKRAAFSLLCGTLALTLASCGGSGGGSSSPPPRPTAPTPAPPPPPPPPPPPAPAPSGAFTVSGQILADPIFDVDSDLNDPAQAPVSNDEFAVAQAISADTEVRGFITRPPAGTGNFTIQRDINDVYEATLSAGQVISLEIFDYSPQTPDLLDLDLYVYDEAGELVSSSIEFSARIEQVTLTRGGRFFIVADAFAGGSNYSLMISDGASTEPQRASQINMASLDVDRLVRLRGDAEKYVPWADKTPGFETQRLEKAPERRDLIDIPRGALTRPASGPLSANFAQEVLGIDAQRSTDPQYEDKLGLLHAMKRTNALAGADVVAAHHLPRLHAEPPPDPDLQWNLPLISWEEGFDLLEAEGIDPGRPLIAVLDTGVLSEHPKVEPVLVDPRDFVPSFIDGDGFDAEAEDNTVVDEENAEDCFEYHGTHVATTATAPREGGVILGRTMVGAMPFADLMMLKLGFSQGDQCRLIVGDVPGAIRYAAGLPNSSGILPDRPADVINLSFGGDEPNPAMRAAIDEAVAAGVIVVASAGNDGQELNPPPSYPASFPDVFAVAAVDINAQRAPYSSFYPQVEIAAPGGDGRFDRNNDGLADAIVGGVGRLNDQGTDFEPRYALYQGTSMAAPHVAAGFALMKAIAPSLTSDDIRQLLEEGLLTDDIALPGRDNATGFGLINYLKMVEAALQVRSDTLTLPPDFRIDPSTIDLGNIDSEAEFIVSRTGDPAFSIQTLSFESAALGDGALSAPEAVDVDSQGFGTYQIVLDRRDIQPGNYVAEIRVTASNGETRFVPVTFTIPDASLQAATAPTRFSLQLLENGAFTTVAETTVSEGAGAAFVIDEIEAGDYRLLYSTDMDFDEEICDPGEIGGSFPGLDCDSTQTFAVDGDVADIAAVLERLPE